MSNAEKFLSIWMARKGYSAEEEPSKEQKVIDEYISGENKDYTVWHRVKNEQQLNSPLTKIKKSLVGGEKPALDPKEMEMGVKEEKEHDDITGGKPELVQKIVEAHLDEDPEYYTKLNSVMKAEEFDPTAAGHKILAPKKATAIRELYGFMSWMIEKGFKAKDEKEFEEKMDRYEIDEFTNKGEEKEKEPEFHAEKALPPLPPLSSVSKGRPNPKSVNPGNSK